MCFKIFYLYSLLCCILLHFKPEACPVLKGSSLDSMHRSSTGILKAGDMPSLYEGAEPRRGAVLFNIKPRGVCIMQLHVTVLNLCDTAHWGRQRHCFVPSVTA